jgi:hypothetical protein
MADKEKTKQEIQIEAEIAAAQENATPSGPKNLEPPAPSAKRQPVAGVKQFRVRTRGVPHFRRVGLMFSPDPVMVEATALSLAQQVELLNTDTLVVEEVGGATKPPAKDDTGKKAG